MKDEEFNALKYGNVIQNMRGMKFVVLHVIRDPAGHAVHVGLLPAIDISDCATYTVSSRDSSETFLDKRPSGETFLNGRTVHPAAAEAPPATEPPA